MKYTGQPMVVSVCSDCENTVAHAIQEAFDQGMRAVLNEARAMNKYWARDIEAMLYGNE